MSQHTRINKAEPKEKKYKAIFDQSPVALIEWNYFPIQEIKNILKKNRVSDVRRYIVSHPALLKRLFGKIAILNANKAAYDLFGVRGPKALSAKIRMTFHTVAPDLLIEQVIALVSGENDFTGEFRFRSHPQKSQDVFMRLAVVGPKRAKLSRVIMTLQDITMWKKIERQLRKRAQLDSLTNLLNHSATMQALEHELIRAKRYGLTLSCMMVDLDFFKVINDKFGHQRGDHILKRVSAMIKNCFRRVDIIGRYGGDEFLVILPETKPAHAKYAAQRLQRIFASTMFTYKKALSFHVTLSIGIAGYPSKKVKDAKDLVAQADKAMYACKLAGRNRIEVI